MFVFFQVQDFEALTETFDPRLPPGHQLELLAFSPKKGLVFAVNSPPPPPPFSWGAVGVLLKIPGGGGVFQGEGGGRARGVYREFWGGGGAEAPFTVKMSPVFGENAF